MRSMTHCATKCMVTSLQLLFSDIQREVFEEMLLW